MKMLETKWKKGNKDYKWKMTKIEMIFILIMTKTMRISQKNWGIFRRLHHFQWKISMIDTIIWKLSMIGTIICQTEGIKCNKKKTGKNSTKQTPAKCRLVYSIDYCRHTPTIKNILTRLNLILWLNASWTVWCKCYFIIRLGY